MFSYNFKFNCRAQALQNFGLAIISIVSGIIVDTHGYLMLELFFLAWLWGKNKPLFKNDIPILLKYKFVL